MPGGTLDDALAAPSRTLHPRYGAVMRDLIGRAISLAGTARDYEAFRSAFHGTFRQPVACDSRETVPAVFGLLALAEGDPQRTIEWAANFGRDTDTIGAMAGAMAGALSGARSMPAAWLSSLDPGRLESERRMASQLAALAIAKASDQRDAWTAALSLTTA
jgi:hypothetical protein